MLTGFRSQTSQPSVNPQVKQPGWDFSPGQIAEKATGRDFGPLSGEGTTFLWFLSPRFVDRIINVVPLQRQMLRWSSLPHGWWYKDVRISQLEAEAAQLKSNRGYSGGSVSRPRAEWSKWSFGQDEKSCLANLNAETSIISDYGILRMLWRWAFKHLLLKSHKICHFFIERG